MSKKKLATRKDTVRFNVTIFPDMKTRLDRMAKKENASLSVLVNRAIHMLFSKEK